jgi:polysaccharide export outer membrane protein
MRKQMICLTVVILLFCIGCQTAGRGATVHEYPAKREATYRLEAPDEIAISVFPQSELDRTVTIRPDGKISLPLIGDVVTEGVTPEQLAEKLTEKFSRYVKNPSVSVIVTGFNSKKIYVVGEVFQQGAYPFTGEMTAFEAVEEAGSFTRRASLKRVILVRGDLKDPLVIDVNLRDVFKQGVKEKDLILQPEDIVYVPPNGFAKVGYAMEQVLFPFTPIFGLGRDVGSIRDLEQTF